MSKITIKSEIDANALLSSVAQLKIKELETFIRELSGILTRKKATDKKSQIAELLNQHNRTVLSKKKRKKFAELYEQLEAGIIKKVDHQEFLKLSEESERLRNERVKLLIQIAHLRDIPFNNLLQELGLQPIGNV